MVIKKTAASAVLHEWSSGNWSSKLKRVRPIHVHVYVPGSR